jgi:hypothetical protein
MTEYGLIKPTIQAMEDKVKDAGYCVGAGSWEDEDHVYACSRKTIGGTFGHPQFEAYWSRKYDK